MYLENNLQKFILHLIVNHKNLKGYVTRAIFLLFINLIKNKQNKNTYI